MARYAIRNERSSDERGRFERGRDLVEWIRASADFPLAEARAINRRAWSNETSGRFEHFGTRDKTGGIERFLDNPWVKPRGPLLDLACASGHNLAFCAKRGVRPLYGVDISLPLLRLARKRMRHARVQQADMVALPFRSDFFGTVIARGALHNTTTSGFLAAMTEIHRVLRPGGALFLHRRFRPGDEARYTHLVLHTYLRLDSHGAPSMVRNFMAPEEIRTLIESVGFDLVGDPAMTMVVKGRNPTRSRRDAGEEPRFAVECICVKRSMS